MKPWVIVFQGSDAVETFWCGTRPSDFRSERAHAIEFASFDDAQFLIDTLISKRFRRGCKALQV